MGMMRAMKIKEKILTLTLSIILTVSGLILLLDQLNVRFIDEFFTPWYLILILYLTASSLAIAIIKKSPIFYVIMMIFASIYLCIAIPIFDTSRSIWDIIFLVPLFTGVGLIMADLICKWSVRAIRFGSVLALASAIILISTLLEVWTIVIPVVIMLIGIAYILFSIIDVKKKIVHEQSTEHYVLPSKCNMQKEVNDFDNEDSHIKLADDIVQINPESDVDDGETIDKNKK